MKFSFTFLMFYSLKMKSQEKAPVMLFSKNYNHVSKRPHGSEFLECRGSKSASHGVLDSPGAL